MHAPDDRLHSGADAASPAQSFFQVPTERFVQLCETGDADLAAAFLVMCRGRHRNLRETSWSADAVGRYLGVSPRRGKALIAQLVDMAAVEQVRLGHHPKYLIAEPATGDEALWLPTSLVGERVGDATIQGPLASIRRHGGTRTLGFLAGLYALNDESEFGAALPENVASAHFQGDVIGGRAGWTAWRFVNPEWTASGPDTLAHVVLANSLGLIEMVPVLMDGDRPLYPVGTLRCGKPRAGPEVAVTQAAIRGARAVCRKSLRAVSHQGEFLVPLPATMVAPRLVGLVRLSESAPTRRISEIRAALADVCRHAAAEFDALAAQLA
ncbi:MAG: hypothetical protein VYB54_15690 [Pseudomonadota bacterium]|nr:hypothetical protein [Pseudomonadota bacterium]